MQNHKSISNIHNFYAKNRGELSKLNLKELDIEDANALYLKMIDIICEDDSNSEYQILNQYLKDIKINPLINELNKTLIHNDFNQRNVAIRKNGKVFIYDWELAILDYPQRDVMEFLSFALESNFNETELLEYVEFHYKIALKADLTLTWDIWKKGSVLTLKKYLVTRVAFYKTAEILMKLKFTNRIFNNSVRMINLIERWE